MMTRETKEGNVMAAAAGTVAEENVAAGQAATEENAAAGQAAAEVNAAAGQAVAELNAADKKGTEAAGSAAPKRDAAPEVFLQYREYEASMQAVTDRVKAHYYAKGYKEGSIENMQIYMKPEDFTAYYVINDGIVGKVNLF